MLWLRIAAGLAGALLLAYQASTAYDFYQFVRWPENTASLGFGVGPPWPSVTSATPATGLKPGDKIVAIRDRPFSGRTAMHAELDKLFPGDRMRVTVEDASGARREVSWQLDSTARPAWSYIAFLVAVSQLMPLLCIATGLFTVLMKPRDLQAWLLFAMLAGFSQIVGALMAPTGLLASIHFAVRSIWPVSMFLFAWYFPRLTPFQQRIRIPAYVVMAYLLGTALLPGARQLIEQTQGASAAPFVDWAYRYSRLFELSNMAAVSSFFALLTHKRFALTDADAHRRILTLLWGTGAAMTPLFLLILFSLATGGGMNVSPNPWLGVPAMLALTLFPISLAYVIIVHRAFGIGVVIRQGLRYALAKRGVRFLQLLLSVAVLINAGVMATSPGMNRPRIMMTLGAAVALILLLRRISEQVAAWVDRKFFREAYDTEQLLGSLSDDVRSIVETRPLLETVAGKLAAALHIDRITMLLPDSDGFQPAYALGAVTEGLSKETSLARLLAKERSPLPRHRVPADLESSERDWLQTTELLLPFPAKDKVVALAALGAKRSEEPYTPSDLQLLKTVAAQTGLAIENAQLAAAVTEAVAQRERLNREIEIAQEVQERLFPQHRPPVEGVDYLGYCRPARGVGGDSYDFIKLDNGIFSFSIGDVSGKGIPAALLMASLQSALRGQAMSHPPDLGVMMGTLNRLIYDSSPSNRYATLFYAELNPRTGELKYVNGGHNAPMILRGDQVIRLEACGPVVGLFRPGMYQQETLHLQPGDLFVGFTDGVSEAMNAADEEWGEDQLAALLPRISDLPLDQMAKRIMESADAFAAGHPQHDDMTLILLRYFTTATEATVLGPIRN